MLTWLLNDAGIYIGIRRPDGTMIDFWIGNKERDRDVFITQFSETVAVIRASDDPSFWREAAAEIQELGLRLKSTLKE